MCIMNLSNYLENMFLNQHVGKMIELPKYVSLLGTATWVRGRPHRTMF